MGKHHDHVAVERHRYTSPMATATVFVNDLQALSAFYCAIGSMMVETTEGDFTVLASSEWKLILVQVPDEIAATFEIAVPPVAREDQPIKLSFMVEDLQATRKEVARHGGVDVQERTPWEWRGTLHLDVLDPEGNVLQLLEAH